MAQKNHYTWWAYIKSIVREYPARQGANLHGVALREYEAVQDAVDATERMTDAVARMSVIRLVHFERTHTIAGAALTIPCGERTAMRWQRRFFEEVARNRGLIE